MTPRMIAIIIIVLVSTASVSCRPQDSLEATTGGATVNETQPVAETQAVVDPTATAEAAATEPAAVATPSMGTEEPSDTEPEGLARAEIRIASTSLAADETLEVEIVLVDIEDLYGVQFQITYDPDLVRVADGDAGLPGIQLTPAQAFQGSEVFVAVNRADSEAGTIEFIATLLGDTKPMAGDVAVASFSLQAVGSGEAVLDFAEIKLAASDASALSVTGQGVTLAVGS